MRRTNDSRGLPRQNPAQVRRGVRLPGTRSETDFAVCCYAIREGVAADEVWSRVQSVGKFAQRGRSYFDITWENAAYDVRVSKFEKIQ